jgi:uncharacterized membrane protein YkvA (DUF1232 family)
MRALDSVRRRARLLKRDTYALSLACRDPRTPWYAKVLAGAIVAYALSPIDLIPDFIPLLGSVDDLVIVPLGLMLALKLIPGPVLAECRERAQGITDRRTSRSAAVVVVAIWIAAVLFVGYIAVKAVQ